MSAEWWEKPGRMADLEQRFNPGGLLRLARSSQEYYDSHGHYLPGVAVLAVTYKAALAVAERERDTLRDKIESWLDDANTLVIATDLAVARGLALSLADALASVSPEGEA